MRLVSGDSAAWPLRQCSEAVLKKWTEHSHHLVAMNRINLPALFEGEDIPTTGQRIE